MASDDSSEDTQSDEDSLTDTQCNLSHQTVVCLTVVSYLLIGSDVDNFVQIRTQSNDFYPFPSKSFALLYLLAHSPRPMVYD